MFMSKDKLLGLVKAPFLPKKAVNKINEYQQVLKYGIFGVLALAVDLGVFFGLHDGAGVNEFLANSISISIAMLLSFGLNSWFNFGTKDKIGTRFLSFAAVTFIGYLVSQAVLFGTVEALADNVNAANIGKVIGLPLVFIVQYILNKKFTFSKSEEAIDYTRDQSLEGKEVAVIGGGFTGLTAAYEMQERGAKVTVFEASNKLGGLVTGFKLKDGTPLEMAYHFLYKTDNFIIDLCKEIGVYDKLNFYPTAIGAFYGGKLYPFNTALDLLKFKPLSFVDRIRTGITGVRLMMVRDWRPLTEVTAYDWLVRVNGKKAADLVWKPLLKGKFEQHWDKVTMAWLWTRIKVRQDSQDLLGKEELGYFDGGFGVIIDELEDRLKSGTATIKTSTKIDKLGYDKRSNKPTVKLAGKKSQTFDAVVSTIPSPVFASLSADHPDSTQTYRKKLQSINYLGALLMVLRTKKPLTEYYWHQIHDEDAPFLVMLSLDALTGPEKIGDNYVYYIGDYLDQDSEFFNASNQEIRKKWLEGVSNLFPGFERKDVAESYIFKFRNAQHIVDTSYEDRMPDLRTPLRGHYLANFSQIFPEDRGTNYAVRDGVKIVDLVDQDLN